MSTVSWLLPVRDGERWLRDSVRSVLASLGTGDECILVDDGSARPVEDFLPSHPGLRLVRTQASGIVSALETARALAQGDYLGRVDADDRVMEGRRRAQVSWLDAHPDAGGVGGRAKMITSDGRPLAGGMSRYVRWINQLAPTDDLRPAALIESPVFHPAVMLRASAVESVGGYRHGDFPEDYDLWLRLIGAGHTLGAVAAEVVELKDHDGRLTRTDPRYDRAAFRRLKMAWAATHLFSPGMRVAVWGAGRAGRPWMRFLGPQGAVLSHVFDLRGGGQRRGVAIQCWTEIDSADFDLLLVCVGVATARQQIRVALAKRRPDLVEGVHWWAVT